MTEYHNQDLDSLLSLLDFHGRPVISMADGKHIGKVEDILVDPGSMTLGALVTSRGGLLRNDVRGISAADVRVWGEDAVLVSGTDVIHRKQDLSGIDNCVSAYESIQKREIINLNGERMGELGDLLVTHDGRLEGIEIDRERPELTDLFGGKRMSTRALPISVVHSFGKDFLVLDGDRIRRLGGTVEEPHPVKESAGEVIYASGPSVMPVTGEMDEDDVVEGSVVERDDAAAGMDPAAGPGETRVVDHPAEPPVHHPEDHAAEEDDPHRR